MSPPQRDETDSKGTRAALGAVTSNTTTEQPLGCSTFPGRIADHKHSHDTNLFQQSNQVVREFLFDDLPVFPVRDSAELDMKLSVGRRDQFAISTLHRTEHRTSEIRDGAGPLALSNFNSNGWLIK